MCMCVPVPMYLYLKFSMSVDVLYTACMFVRVYIRKYLYVYALCAYIHACIYIPISVNKRMLSEAIYVNISVLVCVYV